MPESAEFMNALNAVLADDRVALAQTLGDHPNLATAAVVSGASRGNADTWFFEAIRHYVYAGDTLLHVAAAGFRAGMAADLLAAGALVDARNHRGALPLHYAADANRLAPEEQAATLDILLKAGADPNAVDKSKVAALHRAVRTRSSAAVKVLLAGGADPCLKNGSGSTPWQLAHLTTGRSGSGSDHARLEQAEIIRLLSEAGAA